MSKKLAIKGHPTRGKEVIELLEMMGGKNNCDSPADNLGLCYLIDDEFDICAHYFGYDDYEDGELNIFTLEEFLEKYPFKVGDKAVYIDDNDIVVISEIKWDNSLGYIFYNVKTIDEGDCFLCPPELLKPYKETNMNENKMKNVLSELYEHIKTTPKEELEREFEELEEWSNIGPTVEEFRTFCECVNRKPKYPKTYEECCKITEDVADASLTCFACNLLNNFQKLLLCRDAYWEIAGEQMGLGKPWVPDWTTFEGMPAIFRFRYNIVCDSIKNQHCLLVFPTEEIRDTFYENFKDLIESCKKLL